MGKKQVLITGPVERMPTDRERQIAQFIVNGLSNAEMAKRLKIAVKTVEAHRANLYKKMKVKNTAQAIQAFVANGIVTGLKVA